MTRPKDLAQKQAELDLLQKSIGEPQPPPLTDEHLKLIFEHTKHLTTL